MNSWHNKLFNDELDLFWQSWPSIMLSWELGLVLSPAQFAVDSLLPTLLNRDSLNLLPAAEMQSCTTFRHKNENAPYSNYCQQQKQMVLHWCSPLRLSLPTCSLLTIQTAWLLYPMEVEYDTTWGDISVMFVLVYSQAVNNNICTAILGYAK